MIKTLIAAFVIFLIATFPASWLLMLFLGNVGLGLSYRAPCHSASSCRCCSAVQPLRRSSSADRRTTLHHTHNAPGKAPVMLADFGTGQVFWSMLWFFLFFIWIWLLIIVFARHLPQPRPRRLRQGDLGRSS